MFPVLLHSDLYRRLRELSRPSRARVWKTLCRLRDGRWGGGTRVKRLRGVARPVYEARSDAGDRLLFTIAKAAPAGEPDRLVAHLQVWDFVAHDDAVRAARRNQAPEAEFLELLTLEEVAIEEPPPYPDATLDELAAVTAEVDEEPLLQFLLPGGAPGGPPADAIAGGIRWLILEEAHLAGEEELQSLFDRCGEELELKLAAEQYRALAAPDPLLLSGSAGSGKTTIAAYRVAGAVLSAGAPRALYLTYSPALAAHAERLVRDLVLARGGDPERNRPRFATFDDLFASLVPHEERLHRARPMTEALFGEWFRKAGRPLEAALVWEELRSILKGACLDLAQPMLDEAVYYELGKKRAPLFVDQRPEIFRIAQRYQEWLAEEGRSDRIDLCRRAFAELKKGHARRWDVVVVDEVQDLTELEVAFVLALARRPGLAGVLLTGDPQQMVNPSGFRWAEVRRLAAKTGRLRHAPPVVRLQRNMRSVRPVVELGNAIVALRREVFGRSEDDELEDAVLDGPVPVLLGAREDEVCAALADFGPRAMVLTASEDEAERLRRRLATSRVLTVREAKGLELEAVVLWRLLAPDRDLVERLRRGDARLALEPRFERLLHHLYVAVTRARRQLAIYEGDADAPFWGQKRFARRLEPAAVGTLAAVFQTTAAPAEWAEQGEVFLAHGCLRQAAECFRRAGLAERESEALARCAERVEDWSEALVHWRRLGATSREAPLLEKLGRFDEAAALYARAGSWPSVARLEGLGGEGFLLAHLRELVERGKWEEALPLLAARREVLRPQLPQVPWFVFVEAQRLAWQESCLLDLLELQCQALSAEADRAWSRAARTWARSGDAARAALARSERVAQIRDPERRERITRALASRDLLALPPGGPAGES